MRREPTRHAGEVAWTWRRVLSILLPVVLLGLPIAAGAEEPRERDAAAQVEVRLSEYAVEMPQSLAAGPTLFLVRNDGRKNHSFKIEGPGVDNMLETVVKPHETGSLQVTLQPGEYKVYCPIGSHAVKGMTMSLTVRAKQP
jgi:plastocyanin